MWGADHNRQDEKDDSAKDGVLPTKLLLKAHID